MTHITESTTTPTNPLATVSLWLSIIAVLIPLGLFFAFRALVSLFTYNHLIVETLYAAIIGFALLATIRAWVALKRGRGYINPTTQHLVLPQGQTRMASFALGLASLAVVSSLVQFIAIGFGFLYFIFYP